jgi:hypothetical protein
MLDSFQPGPNFGKFKGAVGSSMGFKSAAQPALGAFNRFDPADIGGRFGSFDFTFPSSRLKLGPAMGTKEPLGGPSATLPSFNELMRGSASLRLNSSGSLGRHSYQNPFKPTGNLGEPGLPSASALFTSSDLGNGVFLSAGTGYGIRSTAGAPAASVGNSATGGPKHSGSAVNFKLSF